MKTNILFYFCHIFYLPQAALTVSWTELHLTIYPKIHSGKQKRMPCWVLQDVMILFNLCIMKAHGE